MPTLDSLRKSYEAGALNERDVAQNPLLQLQRWLDEAIASGSAVTPEPNAMTLSTVEINVEPGKPDGIPRPASRIVLIKGLDADPLTGGIAWFTNYDSRKGRALAANPFASLQFHWVLMERQVRIEGRVEKVDRAASEAYFNSRPLGSRVGAWASPQSQTIASRQVLENNEAAFLLANEKNPLLCPPHWGGYKLVPDRVEFWQGRTSRLHDRLEYRLVNGVWQVQRLAP